MDESGRRRCLLRARLSLCILDSTHPGCQSASSSGGQLPWSRLARRTGRLGARHAGGDEAPATIWQSTRRANGSRGLLPDRTVGRSERFVCDLLRCLHDVGRVPRRPRRVDERAGHRSRTTLEPKAHGGLPWLMEHGLAGWCGRWSARRGAWLDTERTASFSRGAVPLCCRMVHNSDDSGSA